MHFDAWRQLPNHPRQRDTATHAARAKHFKEAKKTSGAITEGLASVVAAVFKGNWYKVDGHSRTLLWDLGEIQMPPGKMLHVRVHEVRSRQELNHLYRMFDNPSAAERPYEQIFGAMRELGMEIHSKRLHRGHFKEALNLAIRGVGAARQPTGMAELDLYAATAVYRDEIIMLDNLSKRGLDPNIFTTGPLAAAMVSVFLWPETEEMWKNLADGVWQKTLEGFDAPGIITDTIDKIQKKNVARDREEQERLFRSCLMTAKVWTKARRQGKERWFKRIPTGLDPFQLLEEVRTWKGYGYEATLFRPPHELEKQKKIREVPGSDPAEADQEG